MQIMDTARQKEWRTTFSRKRYLLPCSSAALEKTKLKPSWRQTLKELTPWRAVLQGQLCMPEKWSRSAAIEPTNPHASPGQWRRVRAHQAVAFLIMVGQPHGTAMGSMRAWDSDGLHQILHAMAPAVDA